ncbi:MAG: hypothetical protein WA393_01680, partial [Nitrososphaeraceae archaeon]
YGLLSLISWFGFLERFSSNMVDLILVDLGYLDSCIVIPLRNVKFDTTSLYNYDSRYYIIITWRDFI